MSRRSGRVRPDAPYRKLPIRRLLFECNRRLHHARGPRAFELVAALIQRWPHVQSGIVYIWDSCEGGRHRSEHCCMAQLMRRCGKTAHRAKYDLADVGLIKLHCAGRGRCNCRRCNGEAAGGKILNSKGQSVSQATGYELDPSVLAVPIISARKSQPRVSSYESPAQRRLREQGQATMRKAVESMRSRAGPP